VNEVYSIIGLDNQGKLVKTYGKLYTDKKEITLEVAKLQLKEYKKVLESIDAETFEVDADEERKEADEALNNFFFDSKFGMKLYSLDHTTKYYTQKTFQIITLNLTDKEKELIEEIRKRWEEINVDLDAPEDCIKMCKFIKELLEKN